MSAGAWMIGVAGALTVGSLAFIVFSMLRSIHDERTPGRSILKEFGLSIALLVLLLAAWLGQGITEYQVFTDQARAHHESPTLGDFAAEFGQSTLENWQSEFLQLFAFVTLAALYIHKGSGESKDGEEEIKESLKRIEEKLGTL
jgi:hypothetical protein